ncbi:two-component system response regulator [Aeromonas diversa CDC 2478-85]|uniref:Two-component system response regulator n=1 Tax=Aeromonas diversa CDC 2478-85 TaxID=1268237 RepID=N9U1R9_9GAMM|nr:response regulator [Aeromonas diversa]ENY72240.1 two-component system response regulator [Aeromonas diversa CDC 2478-85]
MINIITDEELTALLGGAQGESAGFQPVTLYALDDRSYRAALASRLPADIALLRTEPSNDWQWGSWFGKSQFLLFSPELHLGRVYWDALNENEGILSLDTHWMPRLEHALLAWREWLGRQRVLILEDQPFQGAQMAEQIRALGPKVTLVRDERELSAALEAEPVDWVVSDLALAHDDAIRVLGRQIRVAAPVILLSGHDQALVDGAAQLLSLRGVEVVGAFTKPLEMHRLLPLLLRGYEGAPAPHLRPSQSRRVRTWGGEVIGVLGRPDASVPAPLSRWLLLASLDKEWSALRQQAEGEGGRWTLVIRPQDELLARPERFSLALQARLAGASLALFVDSRETLSFELLERLPLDAILVGAHLLPLIEQGGLIEHFIERARAKGCQLYLDDPYGLLDDDMWQGRGFQGRW